MSRLDEHPKIIRLAGELGLSKRGNSLRRITEFALSKVEAILETYSVGSLDELRLMVANKVLMKIECIEKDDDIEQIVEEYPNFHSGLIQRLRLEFIESSTEGITLEREKWDPIKHRYLAVIDARGSRSFRAYFTTWHEISHLLIHPAQKEFPGFRRTPTKKEIEKDPIESLVDHISGHIAFYEPFFKPVITSKIKHHSGLTFEAIEDAKNKVAPDASLFATAIQSINYYKKPAILLRIAPGLKKKEKRVLNSQQQRLDFAKPNFTPKIRAKTVIHNEVAKKLKTFEIRPNMRVPTRSVLYEASENLNDTDLNEEENQDWWKTSLSGHLGSLPIKVEAIRRGRFVYGLITSIQK